MNDDLDSRGPHPHIAPLLRQYARDLAQITPSSDLDARIGALVAAGREKSRPGDARAASCLCAAAGLGALAIGIGIYIGMKLEQSTRLHGVHASGQPRHEGAWSSRTSPCGRRFGVLPDSAEFLGAGQAGGGRSELEEHSTRYWIDVVVSNDGTFRIERVVPADSNQANPKKEARDAAPKIQ
jgi:hypothetical protein